MPEGMRDFDRGIASAKSSSGSAVGPYPWTRTAAGSYSYTAVADGFYDFRLWGAGSAGACSNSYCNGGAGGGFCRKRVYLKKGQAVAIVLPAAGMGAQNSLGTATSAATATFPDGSVMIANSGDKVTDTSGAVAAYGGTASGGDLNLTGGSGGLGPSNGSAAQGSFSGAPGLNNGMNSAGGGGASPGDEFISGGNGGNAQNTTTPPYHGTSPGGGGGGNWTASYPGGNGGTAQITVIFGGMTYLPVP